MKLHVGTSGFAYKEWKGGFYPKDLKNDQMLSHYAQRLTAVEINNTFYRLPRASVLETWAGQTPPEFLFVIKASQKITHHKRLKEAADPTDYLLRTVATLEQRLGLVFFQLPANFKKDAQRLDEFLNLVPLGTRTAFEFRHASWFDDEVLDVLRKHQSALCYSDGEGLPETPLVATAPWAYIRLRQDSYTRPQLSAWVDRLGSQGWREAFVFFKHDGGEGPAIAERMLEITSAESRS